MPTFHGMERYERPFDRRSLFEAIPCERGPEAASRRLELGGRRGALFSCYYVPNGHRTSRADVCLSRPAMDDFPYYRPGLAGAVPS